ncbi:Bardet-Biedl syndrome 4 protein [Chamberlinius hualienensis]
MEITPATSSQDSTTVAVASRPSTMNKDSIGNKTSRTTKSKKAVEVSPTEKRNWLIHLNYLRNDREHCQQLIECQLNETQGTCEYAMYLQGLMFRSEGKLQDSLEMFHTCTILNGNSINNVKQVARSLFLLGRHKAAADLFEESKKLTDKDWDILHGLGECYHCMGDLEKAKECFREAFVVGKREESFIALGKVCMEQNEISLASEVYKKALEYFPDSYELHTELGLLYLEGGSQRKAFEHIGAALTLNPKNTGALLAAGVVMHKNSDIDAALSKYHLTASLAPDSASLWNNVGMSFFKRKKYVASISCLKRALFLAPLEWKILYNLGLVHLTMQQYASAFHFLSSAINLNSCIGKIFMLLAIALTYLQDAGNARLAYQQAVSLDK